MPNTTCPIDDCERDARTRGWCKNHYELWRRTGSPLGVYKMTQDERFWAKVDKSGDCWQWTGSITRDGYGMIRFHGRGMGAHRVAWIMAYGEPAPGQEVDHRCHNRSCVNVAHMRLASKKQNMENRKGAHRNSKSGIRGVHWSKSHKRWCATVDHNNKHVYMEYFIDLDEAAAAVVAARNAVYTHNEVDRRAS